MSTPLFRTLGGIRWVGLGLDFWTCLHSYVNLGLEIGLSVNRKKTSGGSPSEPANWAWQQVYVLGGYAAGTLLRDVWSSAAEDLGSWVVPPRRAEGTGGNLEPRGCEGRDLSERSCLDFCDGLRVVCRPYPNLDLRQDVVCPPSSSPFFSFIDIGQKGLQCDAMRLFTFLDPPSRQLRDGTVPWTARRGHAVVTLGSQLLLLGGDDGAVADGELGDVTEGARAHS